MGALLSHLYLHSTAGSNKSFRGSWNSRCRVDMSICVQTLPCASSRGAWQPPGPGCASHMQQAGMASQIRGWTSATLRRLCAIRPHS